MHKVSVCPKSIVKYSPEGIHMKKTACLVLCLLFALTFVTAAGAATSTITKNLSAQVGQRVNYSIATNPDNLAIRTNDLSALDEYGLNESRVERNRIVVSGVAERKGLATVNVEYGNSRTGISSYKLRIRIDGPEMPPKTGDNNRPLLFAGIALLSLLGFACTAKNLRKN